jgi:hypothetical protein
LLDFPLGAIALLVLTYVALACARLLAGWKENLTIFIALGGTVLAIFAIDATLLPYLTNTSSPVVLLLNLVGFGLMSLGAFIIWYRRRYHKLAVWFVLFLPFIFADYVEGNLHFEKSVAVGSLTGV